MLPFLALLLLLFINDWKERELICWSEEDIYTIFVDDDRPSELLVLLGVLLKTLAERGDSGALRRRRLVLLLKSRYH